MRQLKTVFLVVALTVAFTLAGELLLAGLWLVTGSPKFDTLYGNATYWPKWEVANSRYPVRDKAEGNVLRVATFGGSSTAGSAAERSFAEVLRLDIAQKLGPSWRVFVRNYAKNGKPFHNSQADLAKALAPFYDVLVIYAGNNEWVDPYQRGNGIPKFGVKADGAALAAQEKQDFDKALMEANGRTGIRDFVFQNSRVFAVVWKAAAKFNDFIAWLAPRKSQGFIRSADVVRPKASEAEKIFPQPVIDSFAPKFKKDLEDIREAANKSGATVVVVPALGNEFWPPYFSKRPDGWTEARAAVFDKTLAKAWSSLTGGDIEAARQIAADAVAQAPDHAYANYVLGMAEFKSGAYPAAWKHLAHAIDEDGFPFRAQSAIRSVAIEVSARPDDSMIAIDHAAMAHALLEAGLPMLTLFSEWMHPTFPHHVLLGRSVYCALAATKKFSELADPSICTPVTPASIKQLASEYHRKLGIEPWELVREMRAYLEYAFLQARITAHPEAFFEFLDRVALPVIYQDRATSTNAAANYGAFKGIVHALLGRACADVADMLNQGVKASAQVFTETLEQGLDFAKGYDVPAILKRAGVTFSGPPEQQRFACEAGAN